MRRRRTPVYSVQDWATAAAFAEIDRGWLAEERRSVRRARLLNWLGAFLGGAAVVVGLHLVLTTPAAPRSIASAAPEVATFPGCMHACADRNDDVEAWRRGTACECARGDRWIAAP